MEKHQSIFKKKELVLAVSIAMFSGVMTGCSSDSSDSAPAGSTISAVGGKSNAASGGDGAEYISIYGSGTDVEVSRSGRVNTDFTSPVSDIEADFGDNPLEVTSNTTIDAYAEYTPTADTTGSFIAGDLYVDTHNVLRTSTDGGVANFAGQYDPRVDDGSLYRSSGVAGELLQAIGDNNDPDAAPAGTPYQRDCSGNSIYIADEDLGTPDSSVSGISVASSRTLTLGLYCGSNSSVWVSNDIENNGTITKTDSGNSNLDLYANHYQGRGDINNAGNADRVSGGEVYISTSQGIINDGNIDASGYDDNAGTNPGAGAYVQLSGAYVQNNGNIDASGGDAMGNAGSGGEVLIDSGNYVENNGNIDISGGNDDSDSATYGYGGSGGQVYMYSGYVTNNTGDIDASGGDGDGSGSGGYVNIYNYNTGEAKNAGNIDLSGGDADEGYAASGGSFEMYSSDGDALNSGNINAAGGRATGTAYQAGQGGDIEIYAWDGSEFGANGNVLVSGNLDVSGGDATSDAGYGGSAGIIDIYSGDTAVHTDQRVALLGYKAINANGGNGMYGGDGAEVWIESGFAPDFGGDGGEFVVTMVAGSSSNEVAINAYGGDTTSTGTDFGSGGRGGWVGISAGADGGEVPPSPEQLDDHATNSAAIDVSGGNGNGTGSGGRGGIVYTAGTDSATNSGRINASGGDGGEAGGDGGEASMMTYVGPVTNSGATDASGGDGAEFGGDAGYIGMSTFIGSSVDNSASLSVDGGDADNPYDAGVSEGGSGGYIELMADNPVIVTNSGNISYSFGTGETDGNEGCAIIGINEMGNCDIMLPPK